jgi:hypothetical protein
MARRTRAERTRLYTRVALLFLLAAVAGVLAITGHGPRTGWTVTAGAFAFTAVCVLIAHLTDKNEV